MGGIGPWREELHHGTEVLFSLTVCFAAADEIVGLRLG